MKNFNKFITGFLSATILFGTMSFSITPVRAAADTIDVIFDAIRVVAEGKTIDNTILYNGTTYVPLREAGELFGKEVTFDTETKTAYIGKIPMKNKSTMENPVEMGNIETVEVNDWGYNYKLDVVLNEVMYKDLANEVMQDASILNKLSYGYEPIVIRATVSNLQSDEPIDVSSKNFEVICDNRIIDGQDFIAPTPAFEGTINTDESLTGYIIYQVPINQDVVLKWKGSENYFAVK